MPDRCPFCRKPADFTEVGDNFDMDCDTCRIKVRFVGTAAAMSCQNRTATLKHIYAKMTGGVHRPFVTSQDMQR